MHAVHDAIPIIHWWHTFRTNVEGTQRLLDAAQQAGTARFVQVSTNAAVHDRQGQLGIDESAPYPAHRGFPYGATKAEAERRVLAANRQGFTTEPSPRWARGIVGVPEGAGPLEAGVSVVSARRSVSVPPLRYALLIGRSPSRSTSRAVASTEAGRFVTCREAVVQNAAEQRRRGHRSEGGSGRFLGDSPDGPTARRPPGREPFSVGRTVPGAPLRVVLRDMAWGGTDKERPGSAR